MNLWLKNLIIAGLVIGFSGTAFAAKDWKKIRIGVEGAYPPFSKTEANGKVTGFDIDIANALCSEMGAQCEMVKQD